MNIPVLNKLNESCEAVFAHVTGFSYTIRISSIHGHCSLFCAASDKATWKCCEDDNGGGGDGDDDDDDDDNGAFGNGDDDKDNAYYLKPFLVCVGNSIILQHHGNLHLGIACVAAQ